MAQDLAVFISLLAHKASMTHPHTPSCLGVVSWANEAPLGASCSASPSTFPSGSPPSPSSTALSGRRGVSAGVEAAAEPPVWASELDGTSFLSWRRPAGWWADKEDRGRKSQLRLVELNRWMMQCVGGGRGCTAGSADINHSHMGGNSAPFLSSSKTDNLIIH